MLHPSEVGGNVARRREEGVGYQPGRKSIWGSRNKLACSGMERTLAEWLDHVRGKTTSAPEQRQRAAKTGGHWSCHPMRCGRISLSGRLVQPKCADARAIRRCI